MNTTANPSTRPTLTAATVLHRVWAQRLEFSGDIDWMEHCEATPAMIDAIASTALRWPTAQVDFSTFSLAFDDGRPVALLVDRPARVNRLWRGMVELLLEDKEAIWWKTLAAMGVCDETARCDAKVVDIEPDLGGLLAYVSLEGRKVPHPLPTLAGVIAAVGSRLVVGHRTLTAVGGSEDAVREACHGHPFEDEVVWCLSEMAEE